MTEEQLAQELANQLLAHFRNILSNEHMALEIQDNVIRDLQLEMSTISTLGRNMVMQAAETAISHMPPNIPSMFSERLLEQFQRVLPPPSDPTTNQDSLGDFLDSIGTFRISPILVGDINRRADAEARQIARELGLSDDEARLLVQIACYRIVILCDNSTSMKKHQRIHTLCQTLYSVASWATRIAPEGISLRFLNGNDDRRLNRLVTPNKINDMVAGVGFSKGTLLGTRLDEKIIRPMITEPATNNNFERPVLVVIITDGEPHEDDHFKIQNKILACKRKLRDLEKFQEGAAVFVVSCVSNSSQAKVFLENLERDLNSDPDLRNMVCCAMQNSLDLANHIKESRNLSDVYAAYLIRLFGEAVRTQTGWTASN